MGQLVPESAAAVLGAHQVALQCLDDIVIHAAGPTVGLLQDHAAYPPGSDQFLFDPIADEAFLHMLALGNSCDPPCEIFSKCLIHVSHFKEILFCDLSSFRRKVLPKTVTDYLQLDGLNILARL